MCAYERRGGDEAEGSGGLSAGADDRAGGGEFGEGGGDGSAGSSGLDGGRHC